jgi:hypothetical protein
MDRSGKDAKSGSFRPEWVAFYSRNSGFLFPEQVASLPQSMHLGDRDIVFCACGACRSQIDDFFLADLLAEVTAKGLFADQNRRIMCYASLWLASVKGELDGYKSGSVD